VEYIQERLHTSQLLSDKQRELVRAAVEKGYYDTPRTSSLTELAEEVGIAKSTCSETLHRAEETMIKQFMEDLPTPIESETRITAPE
jgi:predicted DNA binding protein